jgi:predicted dehydrogenase
LFIVLKNELNGVQDMKTTRRNFIKLTAVPAIAAPFILPSRVWMYPPSKRITMGFVGMGKQSQWLLAKFLPLTQVLAVCEVDTTRRDDSQKVVNKFYNDNQDKGVSDCKSYNDYRELIDRRDIDTVCIATPDHWHAEPILLSLGKGKDVFCEKPLTHTIQEAIDVMKAVDKNIRVLQTGSMQRSMKEFRIACELVRNGCIGKIDHVECSFGGPPVPCDLPGENMEPGLDWNLWLGPAPMRSYNSILSPRGVHDHYPAWRSYKEYGTGGVCDWGAHHLDIAQWGLGMDESGPVEVRFIGTDAALIYSNGIKVLRKENGFGVHFFGSEGEVMVNRGTFKVIVKNQTIACFTDTESKNTSCMEEVDKAEKLLLKDARIKLYESNSHYEDFLSCVRSRKKPVANEQVGGRTVICCHLINQLYFNNSAMKWDPVNFGFTGGTGDASWLTKNKRDWTKA